MKRNLFAFALILAMAIVVPLAGAADYPTKPICLVVPYPPGGGTDLSARIVADALSQRLGQQVIVENRPGATGTIGSTYALKSRPDGYTLLWNSTDSMIMVPALKPDIPYKIPDDMTFIAKFAENGMVVAVSAKLPVKSLADFIAYAKANPGKLHFGSTGIGGSPHLATLLFEKHAGISMIHVPYPGIAPCLVDLLAGRIDFALVTPITIAPYINSDKLHILAITSPARHPMLPNTPTLKEVGLPQATATVWYGMLGPSNLPAPVTKKLEAEMLALSKEPALVAKLETAGLQMSPVIGDDFKKSSLAEYEQWKEIAKANNLIITE